MMTAGGLWLRHGLAFAAGLAVLFGAGEGGVALFAGLKGSPLVWHLVIAALATALAALAYAIGLRVLLGAGLTAVFSRAAGLTVAAFVGMAGLIYAGLTTAMQAFVLCAAIVFVIGGLLLRRGQGG